MARRPRGFAPGLPDPKLMGNIGRLPTDELLQYVIQEHRARRAGRHLDLRFGRMGKKGPLYSWAVPSGVLPEAGKKQKFLAVRQPLHAGSYASFEGEITEGYGAGTVKTVDRGTVLVTKAQPDKINFVVAHRKFPERFSLIKMKGGERDWLLLNTTPTEIIPHKKVNYTRVEAKDVEKLFDPKYLISEKIDGAAALMKLFHDKLEILSYRPSVKGVPIVHTMRVGGTTDIKIPKHLVGSVLRGEIYGVRKDKGDVIPPQELGGILNASLAKSLEKQREGNIDLRVALFNVLQRGKEPVGTDVAYPKKLDMLREMMQHLPGDKFHLPRMATEPAKQRELWRQITKGINPRTREGIVAWPIAGGKPLKVKITPESDVYVRSVFPGGGKLEGRGAGGFNYALTPTGPVVGRVGTGFDTSTREDMFKNPQDWVGRVARIRSQDQFSSGAYRAPGFIALHEDYPAQLQKTSAHIREFGFILSRSLPVEVTLTA